MSEYSNGNPEVPLNTLFHLMADRTESTERTHTAVHTHPRELPLFSLTLFHKTPEISTVLLIRPNKLCVSACSFTHFYDPYNQLAPGTHADTQIANLNHIMHTLSQICLVHYTNLIRTLPHRVDDLWCKNS